MKVGLLTFHSAHNYGAVLQAYATQEVVKSLGHEIELIEYCPPYLIKQRIFPGFKNTSVSLKAKLFLDAAICLLPRSKRRNGFENFIASKLNLSKQKYGSKPFAANEAYDAFIMGSDQIWNISLTKGFDPIYWGDFATKKDALKISYAASMSNYLLNDLQKQMLNKLLQNFNSISVREEELADYLSKGFAIETATVLDPTFLLSMDKWKLIGKKPKINKKYVLVYSVDLRDDAVRIASEIAKKINAVVIELTMGIDKNALLNQYQTASPEEYVGLFEHADFVVSSSFHGTAFSIIFNKPFYSVAHGNDKDSRQKTILNNLGLSARLINKKDSPDYQEIDYTNANAEMEKMRAKSIAFLKDSLTLQR